jgi:hypothetical protein
MKLKRNTLKPNPMKSKLLVLSFLMLLTVATNYAQTTASAAGIAIQGIARDDKNTARVSANFNLTFRIYHGANILIYEVTKPVTTDSFGVFSVVLEPGVANNVLIANNQAFLKISEGTTTISEEQLKHVPYAIAATYASNGVPTGSIMPYIGTTAPAGWALCNGAALPTDGSATGLIALVGANAPNLGGMFLRGAGVNTNTGMTTNAGPKLKETQGEDLKPHEHEKGTLGTTMDGMHNHNAKVGTTDYNRYVADDGNGTVTGMDHNDGTEFNLTNSELAIDAGNHSHTITGTTGSYGGTETRPVNYGVNYIIKL